MNATPGEVGLAIGAMAFVLLLMTYLLRNLTAKGPNGAWPFGGDW